MTFEAGSGASCAESLVETKDKMQGRITIEASVVRRFRVLIILSQGSNDVSNLMEQVCGAPRVHDAPHRCPTTLDRLVGESQGELNRTGEAALMVDHAEVRSQADARLGELRMIEEVEYFSAKFQLGSLGYVERFVGRKIEVHNLRCP